MGDYMNNYQSEEENPELMYMNEEDLQKAKYQLYAKTFEPSVLIESYITPEDDLIKKTDIPERMQLRNIGPREIDEELEDEAEWIYKKAFTQLHDYIPKEQLTERISDVLRFLWVENLEIPFIGTYRKDYWYSGPIPATEEENTAPIPPTLQQKDLWVIYDWDEKWVNFQSKKKKLKELYEAVSKHLTEDPNVPASEAVQISRYIDMIENRDITDDITDLADFQAHYQLYYSDYLSSQGKTKRPVKRDMYSMYKKAGIDGFKKYYGITPKEIAENFECSLPKYSLQQDPELPPEEIATNFICDKFSEIEEILSGARHIFAKELSVEPAIRKDLSQKYSIYATISTVPTEKGKKEIDSRNMYWEVKRLAGKPTHDVMSNTQFILITRAKKEGLLTYSIDIPENHYQHYFVKRLEEFLLSDGTSEVAAKWNEQRSLIIKETLKDYLFPVFEKQLQDLLLKKGEEVIISSCAEKLEKKLMEGPYKPKDSESFDVPIHVMACHCDPDNKSTECVLLDQFGEYKSHISLQSLPKSKDVNERRPISPSLQKSLDALMAFIKEHHPDVIAIAADGFQSRQFYALVHEVLTRLKIEIHFIFANPEAANIYSSSKHAEKTYPSLSIGARRAISLGRRVLDPLVEYSRLCNRDKEVLCLKLHNLQDFVNQNVLFDTLERVFVTLVNAIGVDINQALAHEWKSMALPFIAGLGHRKALHLLQELRKTTSAITKRADLTRYLAKDKVWRNAIGFLKVCFTDCENLLDTTRIHPEDYNYAIKIAMDAIGRPGLSDEDYVSRLMQDPKKLDDINIEDFADLLHERMDVLKRYTLYEIKNELNNPFRDCRNPYADMEVNEVFSLMEEIEEGMLVAVRVLPYIPGGSNFLPCAIENSSVRGRFRVSDIVNSNYDDLQKIVPEGTVLQGRIKEIDRASFSAAVTVDPHEIDRLETSNQIPADVYWQNDEELTKKEEKKQEKKILSRGIVHPFFKNIDAEEVEQYLSNAEPGTVVIRPSSRVYDRLTLSYKFYEGLLVHVEIKEGEKTNQWSLGKKLYIGNEVFDDLNEIIVTFVDPIMMFSKEVVENPKFKSGTKEAIETQINIEKSQNPNGIPYAFGVSYDFPGRFTLYYKPRTTIKKEFVTPTPKGLRFRNDYHKDLPRLVHWFKQHYKEPYHASRDVQTSVAEAARMRLNLGDKHGGPMRGGYGNNTGKVQTGSDEWGVDGWGSEGGASNATRTFNNNTNVPHSPRRGGGRPFNNNNTTPARPTVDYDEWDQPSNPTPSQPPPQNNWQPRGQGHGHGGNDSWQNNNSRRPPSPPPPNPADEW
eukprot:TRINITY_DN14602_c0_g1_i1.p1 TRINITY_DN14602_c0_g1~~TRINITY_DN14602_c0_g1_i1.p1  ORF type:complete len:1488 (+),score=459.79 TRINITY_DN14602_c0_g1_i1:541-4464(+)